MGNNNNSGNFNSGDFNSGDFNSGYCNSGDFNSGDFNSGDCNNGNFNSGNFNSGDFNSGDFNSGDRNSGDFNSGDRNSGNFNTDEPKMRWFNKDSNMTYTEYRASQLYLNINLPVNKFVWVHEMTTEEKENNPEWNTTGGYLKKLDYKEAWLEWWKINNTDEMIRKIKRLPNFNAHIFFEITGIRIEDNNKKPELLKKANELIEKANELKAQAEKM